jgi:hypothetical protein
MLKLFKFTLILGLFASFDAHSQLPDFGPVFLQNEVAIIRITINQDTLDAVLAEENWGNDREFHANFKYESNGLVDSMQNIGFRLRGNTSLQAAKKSFKVSFNAFEQGNKWQGLEKMNLNGSHNDPSMIRAALVWDVIRNAELPGARTSFVKLYFNDEYRGLYTNVEHIDENFTKSYFPGSQFSTQFKCLYPAPLDFISNSASSYNFEQFGRRPYDQKINDYTQDYRELAEFISILNNTSIEALPCALERKFDVDSYLKYAAISVLTGNWDGYEYNKNNYYLQLNRNTGQFHFIPYDVDNTMGIDWLGQDWANRNVMNWAPSNESRPLFKRLLQVNEYSLRYQQYIREFSATIFHPDTIVNKANSMIALISDAAFDDTYRVEDYGFTFEDFLNSVDEAWGNQVNYGIAEYSQLRVETALQQTNASNQETHITGGWIDQYFQSAFAKCSTNDSGSMHLFISDTPQMTNVMNDVELFDNGVFPDLTANDGIYSADVSNLVDWIIPQVYYQFNFTSSQTSQSTEWPCNSRLHFIYNGSDQYLNEIMSDNSNTEVDEIGLFSDWIEVYNPNSSSWNMDHYYLSDDSLQLNKWPLPLTTLNAHDFHVFRANKFEELNRDFCNFSLSSNGESLFLSREEDDAFQIMQWISIPPLGTNESYGPIVDGTGAWTIFQSGLSTYDASNSPNDITRISNNQLVVFPNPAKGIVYFSRQIKSVELIDTQGRIINKSKNTNYLTLEGITAGIYILNLDGSKRRIVKN